MDMCSWTAITTSHTPCLNPGKRKMMINWTSEQGKVENRNSRLFQLRRMHKYHGQTATHFCVSMSLAFSYWPMWSIASACCFATHFLSIRPIYRTAQWLVTCDRQSQTSCASFEISHRLQVITIFGIFVFTFVFSLFTFILLWLFNFVSHYLPCIFTFLFLYVENHYIFKL